MSRCSEMIAPKDGSLNFSEALKFGCIPLLQVGPHPPTPSPRIGRRGVRLQSPSPFLECPLGYSLGRGVGGGGPTTKKKNLGGSLSGWGGPPPPPPRPPPPPPPTTFNIINFFQKKIRVGVHTRSSPPPSRGGPQWSTTFSLCGFSPPPPTPPPQPPHGGAGGAAGAFPLAQFWERGTEGVRAEMCVHGSPLWERDLG